MALTYLDPARHRLNLTIKPGVTAARVVLAGKRVVGVEVESGEETFTVLGGEIVLCSGTIGATQLLMLSGVGPREQLEALGIQSVHHLPGVGQNMRDYPQVRVQFRVKPGFPPDPIWRRGVRLRYTGPGIADP